MIAALRLGPSRDVGELYVDNRPSNICTNRIKRTVNPERTENSVRFIVGPAAGISADYVYNGTRAKWIVSRAEMVCRQTGHAGPSRCIDGTLVTAELLALIGADYVDCGLER